MRRTRWGISVPRFPTGKNFWILRNFPLTKGLRSANIGELSDERPIREDSKQKKFPKIEKKGLTNGTLSAKLK